MMFYMYHGIYNHICMGQFPRSLCVHVTTVTPKYTVNMFCTMSIVACIPMLTQSDLSVGGVEIYQHTPTPGPFASKITTNAVPLSPAGKGEEKGRPDTAIQMECEYYHYVNHTCVHEHVAYANFVTLQ